MKLKNKRGFLLAEETLKIIIALVCISFLIYFLASLYFAGKEKEQLEFAEASLNHLIEGINSNVESVEIYNPKDWVLTSWPKDTVKSWLVYDDVIKKDIPNSCSNVGWNDCLCLCDDAFHFEGKDCDNLGLCVQSDYRIVGEKIKIENPPVTLEINDKEIVKR